MTFKEIVKGTPINDESIDRILRDTNLAEEGLVRRITQLWDQIVREEEVSPSNYKLVAYTVNLTTGAGERVTRCWLELCEPWKLLTEFHEVTDYEAIDIWNSEEDKKKLKSLLDIEVLALIKEGGWMRNFDLQMSENALDAILGAETVGGFIFKNSKVVIEVLIEQLLYQERGISPFASWHPKVEYSLADPNFLEKYLAHQSEINDWGRSYLFNKISRYEVIKEAAQVAEKEDVSREH